MINLRPRELVGDNSSIRMCFKSLINRVRRAASLRVQVEIIKKAYNQESEEYEEDEVSPREVAHNIYILAQQVTSSLIEHWNLTGCLSFPFHLLIHLR